MRSVHRRLEPVCHRDPSAVGRPPCSGEDHRHQERPRTNGPHAPASKVLSPERQLAAFDLENTIIASNVVFSYAWLATREMGAMERVRFACARSEKRPVCSLSTSVTEPTSSATSTAATTERRWQRWNRLGPELLADHILTKAFPAALRRVREHRALGHRTVLITGALNIVVDPLRPLFDDVICTEMTDPRTSATPAN